MSRLTNRAMINTVLKVRRDFEVGSLSSETVSDIQSLKESGLYALFWKSLATPRAAGWLIERGLINSESMRSTPESYYICNAFKSNSVEADASLASLKVAPSEYDLAKMLMKMAGDANDLRSASNLLRIISEDDFPRNFHQLGFLAGEVANKLSNEVPGLFLSFNLKIIDSMGKMSGRSSGELRDLPVF